MVFGNQWRHDSPVSPLHTRLCLQYMRQKQNVQVPGETFMIAHIQNDWQQGWRPLHPHSIAIRRQDLNILCPITLFQHNLW